MNVEGETYSTAVGFGEAQLAIYSLARRAIKVQKVFQLVFQYTHVMTIE